MTQGACLYKLVALGSLGCETLFFFSSGFQGEDYVIQTSSQLLGLSGGYLHKLWVLTPRGGQETKCEDLKGM